jgi:TRAP-type C4-dicarboxylate transport system substrate-binding protein
MYRIALGGLGLLVVVGGFLGFSYAAGERGDVREIRWLIAHQPISLFEPAAKAFQDEFNSESRGTKIRVVVLGPSDIVGGNVPHLDKASVYAALDGGKADIATIPIAALGSTTPASLVAAPFLFSDYGAMEQALDGDVGTQLLQTLAETGNVRGLAFTLSGGYQVLATRDAELDDAKDLAGLRVATPNGAIAADTLRSFGAIPVPVPPGDTLNLLAALDDGTADAVEITYTRLSIVNAPPVLTLNETDHSIFFTAILSGNAFYESLSEEDQTSLRAAARRAAQVERADSIELARVTKEKLQSLGSSVVAMPRGEREILRAKSRALVERYTKLFDVDYLSD